MSLFLGEYLIKEMQERGENKSVFAKKMHIHPTQLTRIINNPTKLPTPAVLSHLAKGLNTSEEELKDIFKYGIDYAVKTSQNKKCSMREAFPYELQHELTIDQIAKIVCFHDEKIYKLKKEFAGSPEQWAEIMSNFPQSTKLFYFEKESEMQEKEINIVGDCSFVFVNDEKIKSFIEGRELHDEKIKIEHLLPMTIPGEYDMYILNMSLVSQYCTPDNIQQVIRSFLERIEILAQKNIFIKSIYVNVYRRDIGFYETLGFNRERKYSNQDTLQEGIPCLYELQNFIKNFKYYGEEERIQRIKEVYEERGIGIEN